MQSTWRLNKYLAHATGRSRREADQLIASGRVTRNGTVATLGDKVGAGDTIELDGVGVIKDAPPRYLALHKPVGYVCSRASQGGDPTVYQLLAPKDKDLKLVGRLDKDSSGIILLTNDGDFAHRMTHPSFKKQKRYIVTLNAALQPLHRQMISDFGVMLDDGKSKFELERVAEDDDATWRITMNEGRNRQIRRTFAALGYAVIRLHRTEFGSYALGDIPAGTSWVLDISPNA